MKYEIRLIPSAMKEMATLPPSAQKRLDRRILALADDPRPRGSKELVGKRNLYRMRVGDCRVLYEVQGTVLLVLVVKVGHRGRMYRPGSQIREKP